MYTPYKKLLMLPFILKVVKVNIDEAQDLAEKYDVMSIPTTVVVKNGQEINRTVGYVGKETILNMVK